MLYVIVIVRLSMQSAIYYSTAAFSCTSNDAYMRHGSPHFFHKAIRIYMGGLTLDSNTLYVDICFLKGSHAQVPYTLRYSINILTTFSK